MTGPNGTVEAWAVKLLIPVSYGCYDGEKKCRWSDETV